MDNQPNSQQPEGEPAYYSTTKGVRIPIREMALPHIENSIRKLEAEIDQKMKELESLRKELQFREFANKL